MRSKSIDTPNDRASLKESPVYSWLKDHGRYSRLKDFPASTGQVGCLEDRIERVLQESILPPRDQPSRSKRRPPCLPSLRTRSFWKALSEPATPEELEEARLVESLDDEIALMRVSTRRMFEAIPDDAPPLEAVKCLDNIGLMCIRIARLSLIQYKMQGEPGLDLESLLKIKWD